MLFELILILGCRLPNYVTENHQIFAVDPEDPNNRKEVRIRGLNWSGMENTDTSILVGLWGRGPSDAIKGTTIVSLYLILSDHHLILQ